MWPEIEPLLIWGHQQTDVQIDLLLQTARSLHVVEIKRKRAIGQRCPSDKGDDNLAELAEADWAHFDRKAVNDLDGTMDDRVALIPESCRFKGTVNFVIHLDAPPRQRPRPSPRPRLTPPRGGGASPLDL